MAARLQLSFSYKINIIQAITLLQQHFAEEITNLMD